MVDGNEIICLTDKNKNCQTKRQTTKLDMKQITFSLVLAICCLCTNRTEAQTKWVGTWAASAEFTGKPDMPHVSLAGKTIVQTIHASIGGNTLRLQLSNEFSKEAVEISECKIENVRVKFGGKKKTTIEPGKTVFSDNISFALKPLQRLNISIKYGKQVPVNATSHRGSRTTTYIYEKVGTEAVDKVDHWYNIAALDVLDDNKYCVVCLGNSITDGRGSTTNEQNRWTDFLAEALNGEVGVINQGIGGNAVLQGGLSEPAVKRFDRDVMKMRGMKKLIIFEGVNDIGGQRPLSQEEEQAFVQRLTNTYKNFTEKAHNEGVKVYLATITPFKGNGYYNEQHDAIRNQVNEWIRTSSIADGIVDFDQLVRDKNKPEQLKTEFSDDWLHLNPKGYEAMGKFAADIIMK